MENEDRLSKANVKSSVGGEKGMGLSYILVSGHALDRGMEDACQEVRQAV